MMRLGHVLLMAVLLLGWIPHSVQQEVLSTGATALNSSLPIIPQNAAATPVGVI